MRRGRLAARRAFAPRDRPTCEKSCAKANAQHKKETRRRVQFRTAQCRDVLLVSRTSATVRYGRSRCIQGREVRNRKIDLVRNTHLPAVRSHGNLNPKGHQGADMLDTSRAARQRHIGVSFRLSSMARGDPLRRKSSQSRRAYFVLRACHVCTFRFACARSASLNLDSAFATSSAVAECTRPPPSHPTAHKCHTHAADAGRVGASWDLWLAGSATLTPRPHLHMGCCP